MLVMAYTRKGETVDTGLEKEKVNTGEQGKDQIKKEWPHQGNISVNKNIAVVVGKNTV